MKANRPAVLIFTSLVIGALVAPASAFAQGYAFSQTSRSFSSIASTGTPLGLSLQDDASAPLSAPFSFPFFGVTISSGTSLYVTSNGLITIGSGSTDYSNTTIPTSGGAAGFFAPFWDDLTFGGGGDAYYQSTSSELVVEWGGVQSLDTGEPISFQVRLSNTGTVRFVYGPNSAIGSWTGSIGLEDPSETLGVSAPCTPTCLPSDVPSGTELVFTPGAAPMSPDLVIAGAVPPSGGTLSAGTTYQVPVVVENQGLATAGANRVGLFVSASSPVTASDIELSSVSVPSILAEDLTELLLTLVIPSSVPSGTFSAALIVDPDNVVSESSESNNAFPLGTFTIMGGGGSGITITTSELPAGTVGIPYNVQLQQSGGSNPSWFILEGSLPSGMNLSSSGLLSGTPAETGSYSFAVEASEAGLTSGFANLTLNVGNGGSGNITVTPTTLPEGRVGQPYSAALTASGGVAPYAFQVISGRPDWMIVSSDGQISGTPTGAGSHSLTISVFDSELADGTAVVNLTVIESGPLAIVTEVPAGVVGRTYTHRVVTGGTPPYQVTIVDGVLPGDMFIDPNGMLAGTPDRAGQWQMTLQVSDSQGGSTTGQFTLRATQLQALEIVSSEVAINLRTDVEVPLEASGGVPPYAWSIVQGSLQSGLTLDPAGKLVGQVQEASTATVTFSVRDMDGMSAQRSVIVVARGYRNTDPETMRSGRGGREGGCVCAAPPQEGAGALSGLLILGLGLVGVGRRRREQRHSRLGDGSPRRAAGVTTPRGRR